MTIKKPDLARPGRHRCKVPDCQVTVTLNRLMCLPHWYQVPEPLRKEIWATWRNGAGVFDPAYRAAVREAVAAVLAAGRETQGGGA